MRLRQFRTEFCLTAASAGCHAIKGETQFLPQVVNAAVDILDLSETSS